MKIILFIFLVTTLYGFEFSTITKKIGLSSDTKYIGVKNAYLHDGNSSKTNKIIKLSLNNKVTVLENNESLLWQKVEFIKDDKTKILGYLPKSILVEDSIQNNFFTFIKKSSQSTNKEISHFTKNDTKVKSNVKNKGFSDEEDNKRNYKKGFTDSNLSANNISIDKQNKIFEKIILNLENNESNDKNLEKFILKGHLK